ncbi:MAG TPA: sulfite exporter TauE/SafE family protein [Vicinamibacterales bacterium]|jgi:uncharacterized membrane protein YfcA|nr:sulfite exporter TauE/SafE family protein [Vicinamibacterales bacterium]
MTSLLAGLANPINALLAALVALTGGYVVGWSRFENGPTLGAMGVGWITNFLDQLGIGSFATTTSLFRAFKMVPDRIIPGTLNVGHTLPTVVEALVTVAIIPVDTLTLFSMIAASVLGAWLGAGIVAKWPKRYVQIGMGCALLVAATLFFMSAMQLFPGGGTALGVRGIKLVVAIGGNFILGALMSLGIGLYAPCMILISLLGMSPRSAYPIMMGSCAFLMPVGSVKFIKERAYSLPVAMGLAIGGIPGVLIAAYIIKSIPIEYVRWLVIVVVVYTALTMLYSAMTEKQSASAQ